MRFMEVLETWINLLKFTVSLSQIKKNKKWLSFLGLVVFGCFLVSNNSLAQQDATLDALKTGAGWVTGALLAGVNVILYAILKFVFVLFSGSMWLLNTMINPEMFATVFFSDTAKIGINSAWSFVRDFFNMFFILIIVLVGLSTILGVSKFKDKTVLLRVVFAAMLINFSKPLTLFVIDVSQIFMRFFAEAISNFDLPVKMNELINLETIFAGADFTLNDEFTFFVVIVTVIIMVLILTVMFFYLAISLIVRMIAFWVLIILSPLAMFGFAMEGTKFGSMKDAWFKKLMSWSFYGPILLFFIWLAIILLDAMTSAISKAGKMAMPVTETTGLGGFIQQLLGITIPFITVVYLMFYGYEQAMATSEGMATSILGAGKVKLKSLGAKATHQMTFPKTREAVTGGIAHRMDNGLSPSRFTKQGRADRQALRNAKAKRLLGGDGGAAENKYEREKAYEIQKKLKEDNTSEDDLRGMIGGDHTKKSKNDQRKAMAASMLMSENNQIKTAADYENAMASLGETGKPGEHKNLKNKLRRETGRENMGAIIEFERNSEIRKQKQAGGSLHGFSAGSTTYDTEIKKIDRKLYEEKLGKKGTGDIFKNQQRSFYLKEDGVTLKSGVLEFLREKAAQHPDQIQRKKFAEKIGDKAVIDALKLETDGKYILGITP